MSSNVQIFIHIDLLFMQCMKFSYWQDHKKTNKKLSGMGAANDDLRYSYGRHSIGNRYALRILAAGTD